MTMSKKQLKIFGQEPAAVVAVLEAAVLVAVAFGLPHEAGVVVTTLVVALGGVLTAWTTKDTLLAALLAAARALVGLVVYLGWDLSAEQIASVLGLLSIVLGGWLRTQTSAVATAVSAPSPGSVQEVTGTLEVQGGVFVDVEAEVSKQAEQADAYRRATDRMS